MQACIIVWLAVNSVLLNQQCIYLNKVSLNKFIKQGCVLIYKSICIVHYLRVMNESVFVHLVLAGIYGM